MIPIYVVKSKFLFPQYFNPIQTHYVISELKNAVRLVNNINTFDTWRYAEFSSGVWLCVMIYIPKQH